MHQRASVSEEDVIPSLIVSATRPAEVSVSSLDWLRTSRSWSSCARGDFLISSKTPCTAHRILRIPAKVNLSNLIN